MSSTTSSTRPRVTAAPSQEQVDYYNLLAVRRDVPEIERFASDTTRGEASAIIERLEATPALRGRPPGQHFGDKFPGVPDGNYALLRTHDLAACGGDSAVLFFQVSTGAQGGRYEGFRFLSREAGSQREPVRDRRLKAAVMGTIARDVLVAATRYGHELGVCGICRKHLTDDDSRAMGIGPDCYKKIAGRARTAEDVAAAKVAKTQGSPKAAARIAEPPADLDMDSIARRNGMLNHVGPALDSGKDSQVIESAIRADTVLTEADRQHVLDHLAYALHERHQNAANRVRRQDEATAARIAAAYVDQNSDLAHRLEAEAGPEYLLRRRAQFGF